MVLVFDVARAVRHYATTRTVTTPDTTEKLKLPNTTTNFYIYLVTIDIVVVFDIVRAVPQRATINTITTPVTTEQRNLPNLTRNMSDRLLNGIRYFSGSCKACASLSPQPLRDPRCFLENRQKYLALLICQRKKKKPDCTQFCHWAHFPCVPRTEHPASQGRTGCLLACLTS